MKKYGALLALIVAILSGIFAVFLANRWLASRHRETPLIVRESVPATQVVIASQDCELGTLLTKEQLTLAEWPKASVPQGAFEETTAVEGRVTLTRLKAGQPIVAAVLATPGSGAGLVAAIQQGKRAMAIRVDEVIGVGGFILPDTFVDVIAIDDKSGEKSKAKLLLERIKVLATAQETFNEDGKPKIVKTVTLLLDPEQAKKLALQTHQGEVQLALRNPLEGDQAPPVKKPELTETTPRVPVLASRIRTPRVPPHTVQVIRRSKFEEPITFKNVDSENRL
jgi:pilus assembly protein CpaB